MITQFGSLYAGHVDLDDLGFDATPANARWLSDDRLASVFDKALALAESGFRMIAVSADLSRSIADSVADSAVSCRQPGTKLRNQSSCEIQTKSGFRTLNSRSKSGLDSAEVSGTACLAGRLEWPSATPRPSSRRLSSGLRSQQLRNPSHPRPEISHVWPRTGLPDCIRSRNLAHLFNVRNPD